ncbi:MAG: glycosyltransferase family 2 protein [Qipengyuania pacifica]
MPDPHPKISVIVATRDRVELLRTCVNGVLHETDYPDIEVIIADNDSCEAGTLDYMERAQADPRVRVVRWPHPFNYSAINNFAARSATGEYLCLLNNDIEVIEPDWLSEMVREAVQPGVGAVGARLLYPDRSIQHAGVAIGIGNAAGHAHRGLPQGVPGYFAQALIARGATAVTGACLLVSKGHFDAVGGLDEHALAVAYNDVDFCLKLRELGLANIYTPVSTLIHHESKSRGFDFAPEHLARYMSELAVFQKRWGTRRAIDPWHHSKLDRNDEKFGM